MSKTTGERKIRSSSSRARNGKRKRTGTEETKSPKIRRRRSKEDDKVEPNLLSNLLSKKNPAFEISLNAVLKEEIKDRQNLIQQKESPDKKEFNFHLWMVYQLVKEAEENKKYSQGRGKGDKYEFQFLGVSFSVRVDKVPTTNARVSIGDKKDKSTQEVADLPNKYKDNEAQLSKFFKGLQGNQSLVDDAYREGLEARMVAMMSDIAKYPGNSALAEKMLESVNSIEEYKTLFVGSGNENSYGALPSQNQTTSMDKHEKERKRIFNELGNFLMGDKQALKTSGADSNVPILRKLRSMSLLRPNLFTVEHDGQKIEGDTFSDYVDKRAQALRDKRQQTATERGDQLMSDEEESETETSKFNALPEAQKKNRINRITQQSNIASKKLRAISRAESQSGQDLERLLLSAKASNIDTLTNKELDTLKPILQKLNK